MAGDNEISIYLVISNLPLSFDFLLLSIDIAQIFSKVGTLIEKFQRTIRNRRCSEMWNPVALQCVGKWEYWNGINWERDPTIEIKLGQGKGTYD